jgi:hypothetical protein
LNWFVENATRFKLCHTKSLFNNQSSSGYHIETTIAERRIISSNSKPKVSIDIGSHTQPTKIRLLIYCRLMKW